MKKARPKPCLLFDGDSRLAYVAPVEDDLAGVAGAHGGEACLVVPPVHAVGDNTGDIQAALEHHRHLVPGLVHLSAVDATDGELVEDDLVPVDGDVFGGDAEHGDLRSVTHVGEHVAKGVGVAGHFKADVEALVHVELLLNLFEWRGAGVDGEGDAYLFGEIAAVLVGIGDNDVTGSGVSSYRCGHDADGAGPGDEDIFTKDGEGQRGVDGVAEGIEDSCDLVRDAWAMLPDVRHWKDDVLGECAVAVYAYAEGVGAEMAPPREAVTAAPADDMALSADELTDVDVGNV